MLKGQSNLPRAQHKRKHPKNLRVFNFQPMILGHVNFAAWQKANPGERISTPGLAPCILGLAEEQAPIVGHGEQHGNSYSK